MNAIAFWLLFVCWVGLAGVTGAYIGEKLTSRLQRRYPRWFR